MPSSVRVFASRMRRVSAAARAKATLCPATKRMLVYFTPLSTPGGRHVSDMSVRGVRGGRAAAHADVRLAALQHSVGQQTAVSADEHDDILVIDGVAQKVGSGIGFREGSAGARKLTLHYFQNGIAGIGGRGLRG